MSKAKRVISIMVILIGSIVLDQLTKLLAIQFLKGRIPQSFAWDIFRLDYVENPGAFLSLGASLSPTARFWILSVAVGLFLVGLLHYLVRHPEIGKLQTFALTIILGGGISNLIDRVCRENGQVIDFMNMGIGPVRTGVFNVADMFILAGIAIFIYLNMKPGQKTATA